MADAADALDETYLEMQLDEKPGGRTPGWERAAGRARAASAIRFALDANPEIAAAESTYEAVFALDDDIVLGVVRDAKSHDIAPH